MLLFSLILEISMKIGFENFCNMTTVTWLGNLVGEGVCMCVCLSVNAYLYVLMEL